MWKSPLLVHAECMLTDPGEKRRDRSKQPCKFLQYYYSFTWGRATCAILRKRNHKGQSVDQNLSKDQKAQKAKTAAHMYLRRRTVLPCDIHRHSISAQTRWRPRLPKIHRKWLTTTRARTTSCVIQKFIILYFGSHRLYGLTNERTTRTRGEIQLFTKLCRAHQRIQR